VVCVLEGDHGGAAGVRASDRDGVLHRFGTTVEQGGAFLVLAGSQPVEGLAHLYVALVGRNHEAGVGEARHLLLHRGHDTGRRVADADHRDAGPEVDEGVAVDVHDDAAAGSLDEDRQRRGDPAGHHLVAPGEQLAGARAGNLGDHPALLAQLGTTGVGSVAVRCGNHRSSR